ncbi:MAG: thioredoxin domain-containing protein [Desulfobacterales bacterium]|nr:MAG: thioredoxin domain-containing protein [Desulfobacterales bacterium]
MNFKRKTIKEIAPLPFPVYFGIVAFLAIGGLADSTYLAISHFRVYTDMAYKSFCAISKALNCDTVSQSPYSIFLDVPVPVWGIIGYIFFLLLMVFAWKKTARKRRMWSLLLVVALVFSICSVSLAFISTFYIKSYCLMCVISYGVNFMLLFYTWLIRKRYKSEGVVEGLKLDVSFLWRDRRISTPIFVVFLTGFVFVKGVLPSYWQLTAPLHSSEIAHGQTADGHPWIGAENPLLEITEFTDYQCFQCKKMHFFLRQLIAEYPQKIRLVHRHFPMDHEVNFIVKEPLHVGSGKLALFAIYAASQNKFWEINDQLYNIPRNRDKVNIKELAEKTGIDDKHLARALRDPGIRRQLMIDIREGIKCNITATPSFIINGEVTTGQIPPEILAAVRD